VLSNVYVQFYTFNTSLREQGEAIEQDYFFTLHLVLNLGQDAAPEGDLSKGFSYMNLVNYSFR
jgi:hypothetical protein